MAASAGKMRESGAFSARSDIIITGEEARKAKKAYGSSGRHSSQIVASDESLSTVHSSSAVIAYEKLTPGFVPIVRVSVRVLAPRPYVLTPEPNVKFRWLSLSPWYQVWLQRKFLRNQN